MMRDWLYRITRHITAWHDRHLSGIDVIHIVAVIIGLLCGLGAGTLKLSVDFVTRLIFDNFDMHSGNLAFFVLPILGILIATAFAYYVARRPMDHASDRIASDMATGNVNLSPRLILGPIVGCTMTLGLGGSAGAEDPIAYTGAAIGSNVGKAFKLDTVSLSNMVGCGAAAAIGGIFMAPIGGVMFALEVLKMRQSLTTVLAIVLSSLTAALTCYIMLGCHTDVTFVPEMRFDMHLFPHVILCGVFCGLYSLYYRVLMRRCRKWFGRVSNIWVKALTGGVLLAVMLYFFPSLYGEGYDTLRHLMALDPQSVVSYGPLYRFGLEPVTLLIAMAAVLLIKPFATSATNDSGGIGGDFTPTFFAGGIAGFMFAFALNHFAGLHLPLAIFAFFGMAAVMSGAISAPLMAIFIAAEMTGLYGFILPLTLAAISSLLTTIFLGNAHLSLRFLHRPEPQQSKAPGSTPAPK